VSIITTGTLAHVAAGRTSLTPRTFVQPGASDPIGSADGGGTRTASAKRERRRGSAPTYASAIFVIAAGTVELIGTPGHQEFTDAVEWVPSVLDGAVLPFPSLGGVQPQPSILLRALQWRRNAVHTCNDPLVRCNARDADVPQGVAGQSTSARSQSAATGGLNTSAHPSSPYRTAAAGVTTWPSGFLATDTDAGIASAYRRPSIELVAHNSRALAHPTFPGSAIAVARMEVSLAAAAEFLLPIRGDARGPVADAVPPAGYKTVEASLLRAAGRA